MFHHYYNLRDYNSDDYYAIHTTYKHLCAGTVHIVATLRSLKV